MRLYLRVGVISLVVIGLAAWLVTGGKYAVPAKTAKVTIKVCTGQLATNYTCQLTHYQTLTQASGVAAAFVDLKAAYNTNSAVQSNCHQLTHAIGRAAVSIYSDVGVAYEHGDNFCWSGYYHGVMEAIAARVGEKNLPGQANQICASLAAKQRYSFDHYNCVHGMGHGFMALDDDEVFTSLSQCDLLNDSWEQQSCYGGVFMENVMADFNSLHHTNYLKADQLMYPCTDVAAKYKQQCYLMQTSYALKHVNYDFAKVFGICGAVPEDTYRQTCFQSLGRDASGNSVSDVNKTHTTCLLGTNFEQQSNCVIGAVKDFISYYHSKDRGLALCDSFTTDLQSLCASTATEYYKSF